MKGTATFMSWGETAREIVLFAMFQKYVDKVNLDERGKWQKQSTAWFKTCCYHLG
jgi:hypothetical protein